MTGLTLETPRPGNPGYLDHPRYDEGRMSSAAQILANRQNAAHSTGPKSPEGKQTSSRNATRHGLTGVFTVLPHDNPEDFHDLAARIRDEFHPQGETENFLVDQM